MRGAAASGVSVVSHGQRPSGSRSSRAGPSSRVGSTTRTSSTSAIRARSAGSAFQRRHR